MDRTAAILLLSGLIGAFAVPAYLELRNIRPVRDGGYWGHFLFDLVPRLFTREEADHYKRQRLWASVIIFPATLLLVWASFEVYALIGPSR